MKIIALYLPQFHEIEENNRWWGEGFTEWVNVKKAKKLYHGHNQPRVPKDNNYYNLLDDGVMKWQISLAKKYGVYGFCFYHYWFNGKMVLEKPAENYLHSTDEGSDLPFCFCWANEAWTKTWHGAGGEKEVLLRQHYGGEAEWTEHFNYLLPFFKDKRYIKEGNMPMMVIYRPGHITHCNDMLECWDRLAKENGFDGIFILSMLAYTNEYSNSHYINGWVDFEPGKTRRQRAEKNRFATAEWYNFRSKMMKLLGKVHILDRFILDHISYDSINKEMLNKEHGKNYFRGVFVDYDDSPRRNRDAIITKGANPKKFKYYLKETIKKSQQEGNDYIFVNAWNEWGESNYLEPDEKYGYAYLEAVQQALEETGE